MNKLTLLDRVPKHAHTEHDDGTEEFLQKIMKAVIAHLEAEGTPLSPAEIKKVVDAKGIDILEDLVEGPGPVMPHAPTPEVNRELDPSLL